MAKKVVLLKADFHKANNSRRIRGESITCILIGYKKNYFAAQYFASQESRNDLYFFVAKYFASSELFASWKSAFKAGVFIFVFCDI